ncbi:hypothetical protein KARACHI_05115 [Pasteurella multocida subsp. multocida]|nr:hypothetical protein BMF22_09100 [Pasteurella multocida]KLT47924.1 hypothetical protein PVACC_05115 [Pasteurella multocida subsp. multocida]KLT51611.1 hypothetical protein PMMV1_05115 [Pasteurella multocida subsp. multocida]KLT55569.1 hypothetical protein PMTHA_04770 [Pasteurella multocida subsp. multocida]KLT56424.1 hypothetical protein ISLM_05110 [Pasteurella multocida subsp. multocida]
MNTYKLLMTVSMFLCLVISVLSKQFLGWGTATTVIFTTTALMSIVYISFISIPEITKHLNSRVIAQLAILMVLLSTSTAFLTAVVMRSACH